MSAPIYLVERKEPDIRGGAISMWAFEREEDANKFARDELNRYLAEESPDDECDTSPIKDGESLDDACNRLIARHELFTNDDEESGWVGVREITLYRIEEQPEGV